MRDDAVKAAAHRAHDEGETKEIEEEAQDLPLAEGRGGRVCLARDQGDEGRPATLHKHEDNERKENAGFRAKGGSCTLWRGQH